MDESKVNELAEVLGIRIPVDLLELALTHRSFAYENGGLPHNERLEFLGDSVLGQTVTVMLYERHPDSSEGDLAKMRASLVSASALAEVAQLIDLGKYLKLGKGEEQTGGRTKSSILADTLEAVIGAAYLSCGQQCASEMVLRFVETLMANPNRFGVAMDPKTSLQELTAERGLGLPKYEISESGPDHSKRFTAEAFVSGERIASGSGTSKKQAEIAAALKAWEILKGKRSNKRDSED